ncbi:CAP domain-containing protein, partial [Haloferax sp. Atlit-24N]
YHDENVVGAGYLATEQELADGLMDQWMNSTGHRKNILTPEWNNIGVGVYIIEESGGTAVYATQNFC